MEPQYEGQVERGPNGEVATAVRGPDGRLVWSISQGGAAPQAPQRGIIPVETAADRRAAEDQEFQRQEAIRAAARDERSIAAVERQAEIDARTIDRQGFEAERALRNDFQALPEVREFAAIRRSYQNVRDTANNASAAGDLSLIFAYMKLLDPTSVVRETEFANAQNAAGVPDQVRNAYNRALRGERLNPRQREDFVRQADTIFQNSLETYNALAERYRGIAEQQGFSPDNIALVYTPEEQATTGQPEPDVELIQGPEGGGDDGLYTFRINGVNVQFRGGTEAQARYSAETWARVNEPGAPVQYYEVDGRRVPATSEEAARAYREARYSEPNPEAVAEAQRRLENMGGGGQSLYQGLSLGFSDEAAGAVAGLGADVSNAIRGAVGAEPLPYTGEQISQALTQASREQLADYRQRRPLLSGGLELAGGVLNPVSYAGGGAITRAPGVLSAIGRGAGVGAGTGAVYGAGTAEGGVLQRADDFARGGVEGGLIGGLAVPAVRAAGAGVNALARPFAEPVSEFLGNLSRRARGQEPVTTLDRRIAELARGSRPDMQGQAAEIAGYGGTPTYADVIGPQGRGQLRALATRSDDGRMLAEDFGAERRVGTQDYAARLGEMISPGDRVRDTAEITADLQRINRELSNESFGAIRGRPVELSPETMAAIAGPEGRRAVASVSDLLQSSVDPAERAAGLNLASLIDNQRPPGPVTLTVEQLDLIRRNLANTGQLGSNERRIFSGLAADLRRSGTSQVPEYETALNEFAQRASLEDAADFGARAIGRRGSAREVERVIQGMNPSQLDVAREAARASLEQAVETPAGALGTLDAMAVGRGQGQRFNALLGPQRAADVRRGAQIGRELYATGQAVRPSAGSQTFQNLADDERADLMTRGLQMIRDPIGGGLGAVAAWMRSRGATPQQADEIVSIALDPSRLDEAIAIADRVFGQGQGRQIVRTQILPLLTAPVSGMAGASPDRSAY